MTFEEKKFIRLTTLEERWDCSKDLIYELVSRNILESWHPEGIAGKKGIRITVASVLRAEENGYIRME